MILYHKYLELDLAGLKCKEFWAKQISWKSLLMFSTTSVHYNSVFWNASLVPGTNVKEVIKKNKTSPFSQITYNLVKYIYNQITLQDNKTRA